MKLSPRVSGALEIKNLMKNLKKKLYLLSKSSIHNDFMMQINLKKQSKVFEIYFLLCTYWGASMAVESDSYIENRKESKKPRAKREIKIAYLFQKYFRDNLLC